MARARCLIFFGYSGATDRTGTGLVERDTSHFQVARTLRLHLTRRFPDDLIEIVCAWHKDAFVNALKSPSAVDPTLKIRQIHYVGHGAGGGLYFGYKNKVAGQARMQLATALSLLPSFVVGDDRKRRQALAMDAGLMSGFFTDALAPTALAKIKGQLAADASMQVWGCFAGAHQHTFDTADAYWNLFNAGRASVDGIARHIARALAIPTTAVRDPRSVHGMDFCYRDKRGVFKCGDVRPGRAPQWLWPRSKSVRWVTFDSAGRPDEADILFLGKRVPARQLVPGLKPPSFFTREVPLTFAAARTPAFPACSPARTGITP